MWGRQSCLQPAFSRLDPLESGSAARIGCPTVFHGISRAAGPSQQGRKTSSANGRLAQLVGQAVPPAKRSGSDQELAGGPGGYRACPTIFHKISRAEGPFKQTTKGDGLS